MRLIRDLDDLPDECRGGAVSIGNFDGVHLGHARIVRRLVEQAHRFAAPAVVFTFEPHPAALLYPHSAPVPLTSTERKSELLAELGVDVVVVYATDEALLKLDAQQFFDRVICDRLAARAIVEGPNFFFGHGRSGNISLLESLCRQAGISLDVVAPVSVDGRIVSSSRIRQSVAQGRVDEAYRMLSRPHRIQGTVVHGAGRGAGLGYPTANVSGAKTLLPGEGIYCGHATADHDVRPAAISIGPNPTFDEGGLKVEVHLIDYQGDLYGQVLEVDFLAKLRNIERFDSVDHLIVQMDRDIQACRQMAAEASGG